jgi:hypothetical protein
VEFKAKRQKFTASWGRLPEAIKAGIVAMVKAAGK